MKKVKEAIQKLLEENDEAVLKALIEVFEGQTGQEVNNPKFLQTNGIGFNNWDAEILTAMAFKYKLNGRLNAHNLGIVRRRIKKYWGQLSLKFITVSKYQSGEQLTLRF